MAELDPFEPDEDSDDEGDTNNQDSLASQGNEEEESDDEVALEPIECRISIAKVLWHSKDMFELLTRKKCLTSLVKAHSSSTVMHGQINSVF